MGRVNLSLIMKTMFLQHSLTSMNLHLKVQGSVWNYLCNFYSILAFQKNTKDCITLWDTSTRRSYSAQITSPRVVRKSCLIHRFLSPLLHEQIQIHRRYSILEKTCSCNRIKLNYQATKKKIESTRTNFCDRLHHNYVTCSKTKKIH